MDYNQVKETIRTGRSCEPYLQKARSGGYICPLCGDGTGPDGTGGVKLYPDNTWYCHKCKNEKLQGKAGDVFDLFQIVNNCDFSTAVKELAREEGIIIDKKAPQNDFSGPQVKKPTTEPQKNEQGRPFEQAQPADYIKYYQECFERLQDPAAIAYLQGRGISLETAIMFSLGYDPAADPAGSGHPCPRIITPVTSSHYVGRSIDPNTPKAYQKLNPKGSTPGIFNEPALYSTKKQEIFVTEGIFDALAIYEASGCQAIATNSTANADTLIKNLEQKGTESTLILAFDNDEAGRKATEILKTGLQRLNISFILADITNGAKDPNEALQKDREAFTAAIKEAIHQASAKPDNTQYYIDNLMSADIARFISDKVTGFNNLDRKAGGLYSGLYVLAAISSLGKTSFALQLADQIAAGGNDVIFFSLEQSRLELVSKSLARITAQMNQEEAITSLQIRKGYKGRQIQEAARRYRAAVNDRLSIIEGNFNCNLSFIGQYIRQYIRQNETRPVIFIDYLQILQPEEAITRQGAKEIIDHTITELKRLSRELDLTIFVISSVNRANYMQPIDFESLKESGSIEFSADVIWGLQLQCLNEELFSKEGKIKEKRERVREEKAANPRKIELVCLKNRYGISNYSCYFEYFPANDLFTEGSFPEDTTAEPPEEWNQPAQIRI